MPHVLLLLTTDASPRRIAALLCLHPALQPCCACIQPFSPAVPAFSPSALLCLHPALEPCCACIQPFSQQTELCVRVASSLNPGRALGTQYHTNAHCAASIGSEMRVAWNMRLNSSCTDGKAWSCICVCTLYCSLRQPACRLVQW